MLENITATQFADILAESWTLRQIMAEKVLANYKPSLVTRIKDIVQSNGPNGKIASIKAVRDLASAAEIFPLFPVSWSKNNTGANLSLSDAKNLVEYVGITLGNLYDQGW